MTSMALPLSLSLEFALVRRLTGSGAANAVYLVRSFADGREYALKLLDRSLLSDRSVLEDLRRRAEGPGNRLHVPGRAGATEDGQLFTITDYLPSGSLLDRLMASGSLPEASAQALVRDMAAALLQLHAEDGGRRIVHGDIKPSNILAVESHTETPGEEFRLSDFDSAISLAGAAAGAPATPTIAYAAPEILRGNSAAPEMDYWALGMVLLTALLGSHRFAGLADDTVRSLLVDDEWEPDNELLEPIRDERCRALVAGLLVRAPASRWGQVELALWLDGDPQIVVRGLRRLGENAAATPYVAGAEAVYTVGNLAEALLRSWNTEALTDEGLLDWLSGLSVMAADRMRQARAMDPDEGLLHFCGLYHPGDRMPPVWRGEPVSRTRTAMLARRAYSGDADAARWLGDFFGEGRERHFPARSGYGDVALLVRSVHETANEYREAWRTVAEAGGPGFEPDGDDPWVHAALICCVTLRPEEREAFVEELFDPLLIMRRQSWFFVFGTDPDHIRPSQLFVLRSLHESSLLDVVDIEQLHDLPDVDLDVLREGVVLPATQRRLLRSLAVRAGGRIQELSVGAVHDADRESNALDPIASPPDETGRMDEAGLDPRLEMRIVRLSVRPGLPQETGGPFHLAMVSWAGAGPGTRLSVSDSRMFFPLPRLSLRIPREGRLLLVLHGSASIRLVRPRLLLRGGRRRAIRIVLRRTHPLTLRRVSGGPRQVREAILRPRQRLLQDNRPVRRPRQALQRPRDIPLRMSARLPVPRFRLLRRVLIRPPRIAVTARQRHYAHLYLAGLKRDQNIEWA